jgi:hypothetical protein
MPVKDDLREFLRQRKAKSASAPAINWEAKKRDWIDAVRRLYETIENDIFKDALAEKLVKIQRRDAEIVERYIGRYSIPELVVQIGGEEVVFAPKAVNVIGASGRIDLIGERDQATIIREWDPNSQQEGWSIVEMRLPSRKLVPLTKDSLLAALRQVMSP